MKISLIINALEELFPPDLQESFDNSGGQVVFNESDITSILLSLDISDDVVSDAESDGSQLIITHHPFIFKKISTINTINWESALLTKLIDKRINLYALHTNLDKCYYNKLAEVLGFNNTEVLMAERNSDDAVTRGLGSIASIENAITLESLLQKVKERLNLDFIIYSGSLDMEIRNIVFFNGSGGSQIERIIRTNPVDAIITGDIGYHNVKYARDNGIPVIDAGHFGTERIMLDFLKHDIEDCLHRIDSENTVTVRISNREENPFSLFT